MLAACDDAPTRPPAMPPDPKPIPAAEAAVTAPPPARLVWTYAASDEAAGLALREDDVDVINIACKGGDLLVHGYRFTPVGSEERMSVGAGNTVVTLVATPDETRDPPAVKGQGPLDPDFVRAVGEGRKVGVNYGYQNLGPYDGPPSDVAQQFVAGCTH